MNADFGNRLGHREARRSTTMNCQTTGAAARPLRARGVTSGRSTHNQENTNPSFMNGTGKASRKSPRISSGRPVLADMTNFAASKGVQQGKTDKMKSYHPQAVQVLPAPTAPSVAQDAASTTSKSGGDEGSRSNVQSVAEYVSDIQSLLFRDEVRFLPRADYMDSQVDITSKMRTILVDWLIEVHMKYRLRTETLHLAINLVDRYLSRSTVMRKRLQLIGVVAMFIAAKFEEISPPEVRDWVYITDNAYTRDEVFHMECHMLTALSFHIVVPTAAQFFDFLQKANGCDDTHRALAQYILELGLLDIRMLQHTPSHVVSAALVLSNKLLKRSVVWPAMMAQESRHSEVAVAGCVEELKQLWEADQAGEGGQLRAVHKKFSCVERHSVAKRDYRNP